MNVDRITCSKYINNNHKLGATRLKVSLVRNSDIYIAILMIISMGLFAWQKLGMNYSLTINPVEYAPYIFNDNDYGGTSTSTMEVFQDSVTFTCQSEPSEITFPFCSVYIPLVPEESPESLDISKFNTLFLGLEFQGEQNDTVLVYLQNDEQGLVTESIRRSNMSVLTPNNEYKLYDLPLDDFHLPSWWVFDHLKETDSFESKFDNVKRIQISTGDNRLPRYTKISIKSLEFRGKWLSDVELYTLIISAWFVYFLIRITYEIITLSRRQKEASIKAKELANLNVELEHSATAKGMFLANMSHEIRTPMNGIYGSLQILKQQSQSAENKDLINKAILSSKSLLTIINDILDFSKIEAGKLELETAPFDIKATLEHILSDFYPSATEKGIDLKLKYSNDLWNNWIGDQVRVKQILLNLVSNAIKFTDKGGVEIKVKWFETNTNDDRHVIQFKVVDTGIGMSPKAIDRLFERFEQADNTTTRKYGGTGLGMSITHSLVELMGGTISVKSKLGKGTQFIVHLPLAKSNDDVEAYDERIEVEAPKLLSKKILIVEDNKVNMVLLKKMLENTEAKVLEAFNGQEGIDMFEQHKPDLIFMDIQMPVLDGRDACIHLRNAGVKTPIVAFTANVLEHEVREYTKLGFDGFLAKPVELSKLHTILNQVFTDIES